MITTCDYINDGITNYRLHMPKILGIPHGGWVILPQNYINTTQQPGFCPSIFTQSAIKFLGFRVCLGMEIPHVTLLPSSKRLHSYGKWHRS